MFLFIAASTWLLLNVLTSNSVTSSSNILSLILKSVHVLFILKVKL